MAPREIGWCAICLLAIAVGRIAQLLAELLRHTMSPTAQAIPEVPKAPKTAVRPVIVGTDFTKRADTAILRAAQIAQGIYSPLCLVHAYDAPTPGPVFPIPEPLIGQSTTLLESAEADLALARAGAQEKIASVKLPKGITADREVRLGAPHEALVAVAEEKNAAAIVVGVRTPKGIVERYLLGATAERVLRLGHCPVLLARARTTKPYERVLVAVDFSPVSMRVVWIVQELFPKAKIVLGTVVPKSGAKKLTLERKREVEQSLAALAQKCGLHPGVTEYAIAEGDPKHGILALGIATNPHLLAVGTHARKGMARFLLGSVAEYVARAAPVDVLAVPPAAEP